jgi:hypothetical protein
MKFFLKKEKSLKDCVTETTYKVVKEALQSVLTTEVTKKNADGSEVIDIPLTISAMRMKARVALDFVNNLGTEVKNK